MSIHLAPREHGITPSSFLWFNKVFPTRLKIRLVFDGAVKKNLWRLLGHLHHVVNRKFKTNYQLPPKYPKPFYME